MTTADTPKRLSDANADALAKLEARPTNDPRIRDKTIQEIAVLALERLDSLTPPSQGKVERARELLANAYREFNGISEARARAIAEGLPDALPTTAPISAITQALTESSGQDARACTCHPDDNPPVPCPRKFSLSECRKSSGQGTDVVTEQVIRQLDRAVAWIDEGKTYEISVLRGLLFHASSVLRRTSGTDGACCEAMREKVIEAAMDVCAKLRDDPPVETWPKEYAEGFRDGADNCVSIIFNTLGGDRALPVSADGRDAMPSWRDLTFDQRRDISTLLQQTAGARTRYEEVREYLSRSLKSKQPDTGAGK